MTAYTYDVSGRIASTARPDGTVEVTTYDALDRSLRVLTTGAGGAVQSDYRYEYDAVGRQMALIEVGVAETRYGYDDRGQLVSEVRTALAGGITAIAYAYDAVGSRTSMTTAAGITTYIYDSADRLTATSGADAATFVYDAAGRLVFRDGGAADRQAYTWNAENRLVRTVTTTASGTSIATTAYDAAGFRVAHTADGVETRFLNDIDSRLASVIEEYAADGTVLASYTRGYDLLARKANGVRAHYHADADGNVKYLTDATGTVLARIDSTAFGVPTTGATAQPYRFAAEPYDSTTGLIYLRARHYDPSSGRFLTPDPFGGTADQPLTAQKYLYAFGAPTNGSDPTGMFGLSDLMASIAVRATLLTLGQGVVGAALAYAYGFHNLQGPNLFGSVASFFTGAGLYTTIPDPTKQQSTIIAVAFGKSFGANLNQLLHDRFGKKSPEDKVPLGERATIAGLFGILPANINAVLSSEDLAVPAFFSRDRTLFGGVYGGYVAINADVSLGATAGILTGFGTAYAGYTPFNAGGGQVSIEGFSFGWSLPNTQFELNAGLGVSISVGFSVGIPVALGVPDTRKPAG